jgi:hypothetical protein
MTFEKLELPFANKFKTLPPEYCFPLLNLLENESTGFLRNHFPKTAPRKSFPPK